MELAVNLISDLGILALCTVLIALIMHTKAANGRGLGGPNNLHFVNFTGVSIGLISGLTCAILLLSAHQTPAGSVIDARAAPAILSGIIGGPIAAVIATILGAAARYSIGGNFVTGGSISIGIYAISGLLIGRWMNLDLNTRNGSSLIKFGLLGLFCTFLIIPTFFFDQDLETSLSAIRFVLPTLLIQNPIGMILLGSALQLSLQSITDRESSKRFALSLELETERANREKEKADRERENADKERKRLLSAIEALPEAFVLYDADDRLVVCNTAYKSLYAKSAKAMEEGTPFEEIIRLGLANGQYPDAYGREEEWLNERLKVHNNPKGPIEQIVAGDKILQIHERRTEDGETVGFRIDITALRRQQQTLEKQAKALREQALAMKRQNEEIAFAKQQSDKALVTDELTGLGNRRGLDVRLQELRLAMSSDLALVVLAIDLDQFKSINDMHGHAAGDHVLKRASQILCENVQQHDYVARVGGDEFVIAMLRSDAPNAAEQTATQIIDECDKPVTFENRKIRFGASVGISITDKVNSGNMLADADIALYRAKLGGRHQFQFYTPELRMFAEERKLMADELTTALATNQIRPYFQPQVSASDHTFVGVEALARWKHPERGFIPPDVFIPLAAELGMLNLIDNLVLHDTILMAQRLNEAGAIIPKVSVNLSCKHTDSEELSKTLEALKPWPCRIAFELLETVDYEMDFEKIIPIIQMFRDQGVEVELDDFGSGRASVTTLLKLRPDRIKLDRQLVNALLNDHQRINPIVKAIVEIGLGLKIPMTAEGVETENQAVSLAGLGCDTLQGFYFSEALPESKLKDWLAAHGPETKDKFY